MTKPANNSSRKATPKEKEDDFDFQLWHIILCKMPNFERKKYEPCKEAKSIAHKQQEKSSIETVPEET